MTYDNGVTQSDPNALFGESITYDGTSPLGATPQYNGNISGITWRNKIEQTGLPGLTTGGQGYTFTYDGANRLSGTNYFNQSGGTFTQNTTGALTENGMYYDESGNLQYMLRKDKNGNLINNLTYVYGPYAQNQLFETNANQLSSITDAGSQNISGTFTYDGNGNMISDSRKAITITYNYLDLPDTIKQGANKLVFTYDAAGNKLYKQLITNGAIVSQRHYIEGTEVTASSSIALDGKVENIAMDEGRIVNAGSGNYRYEYFLQDHLYTNRVTFMPNNDGTISLTEVQNYYPFGEDMGDATMNYSASPQNLHKYNGKEWQPELNLNTYDFGARHYDPVLGRWTSVDPLAAESDDMSPYNYVENNPINMIDPDGMQPNSGYQFGFPIGGGSSGGTFGALGGLSAGVSGAVQFGAASAAFSWGKVTTQNWGGFKPLPAKYMMQESPRPQETIRAWQPNIYDKWKSSGFLGNFTYGMVDDGYVAIWSVFWPFGEVSHLNGEYATPKDKQTAFAFTAASALPIGKGSIATKAVLENVVEHGAIDVAEKNIFSRLGPGVYDIETTTGKYLGQSNNMFRRFIEHFASGGKLDNGALLKDIYHAMPGSTKLEREVYEHYIIRKAEDEGVKLLNKVRPMGGREKLFEEMIDNVIKKFNLPK